mgnify:CR=1 FL=1
MGDKLILFNFTIQILYLTIILLVIKEGLKNLEFINNRYIIFYLIIISLLINFIFYGISIKTFIEALISVSFVTLICEIYRTIKYNN